MQWHKLNIKFCSLSRRYLLSSLVVLCASAVYSCIRASEIDKPAFSIRGTLPWHNFLSGPSAWNLADYED